MSYEQCCYPQSWWNVWHWFRYWAGEPICQINCGNCTCVSSSGSVRGVNGPDMVGATQIAPEQTDPHPYCDRGFVGRLKAFFDYRNEK